jgi:hypothetical protein
MYLELTLSSLPAAAKSQRTMLATWLCELLLHQLLADAEAEAEVPTNDPQPPLYAAIGRPRVDPQLIGGGAAERVEAFKDFLREYKCVTVQHHHWHMYYVTYYYKILPSSDVTQVGSGPPYRD